MACSEIGGACIGGGVYAGFYNGFHYLTTPGNCNNSATPSCSGSTDSLRLAWGTGDGSDPAPDSPTDRLNGSGNTEFLATSYTDTDAAQYCNDLVYGGYDDWFLPAIEEIRFLLGQPIPGVHSSGTYISSTHTTTTSVFATKAGGTTLALANKTSINYIRCVRKYQ